MKMSFASLAFAFFMMVAGTAFALVARIDMFPAFRLNDQAGQEQTVQSLMGEKGLFLVFVRSVDWCPYCKKQVMDFQSRADAFNAVGYNVVIVSYDSTEKAAAFTAQNQVTLPVLSDEGSALIKTLGILNTEHTEGSRFYGIPHPTIYRLNTEGAIIDRYAEQGYKARPDINKVLADIGG